MAGVGELRPYESRVWALPLSRITQHAQGNSREFRLRAAFVGTLASSATTARYFPLAMPRAAGIVWAEDSSALSRFRDSAAAGVFANLSTTRRSRRRAISVLP